MSAAEFGDANLVSTRELRRLSVARAVPVAYSNRSEEAALDLEAERSRVLREAYEVGYADGLSRAAGEAARAHDETSRQLTQLLEALRHAVADAQCCESQARRELQETASALAFTLLEELVGREVALASNPGRDAIARALALDSGSEPATVRLHPADYEVLGELDELGEVAGGRELRVVPDERVDRGGALVEIGRSTLDGQLHTALARVRAVLLGDGAKPTAATP